MNGLRDASVRKEAGRVWREPKGQSPAARYRPALFMNERSLVDAETILLHACHAVVQGRGLLGAPLLGPSEYRARTGRARMVPIGNSGSDGCRLRWQPGGDLHGLRPGHSELAFPSEFERSIRHHDQRASRAC